MADKNTTKPIAAVFAKKKSTTLPEESTKRENDEVPAIVINCGSDMCRVGFAGNDLPTAELHTIVGKPKTQAGVVDNRYKYIGERALVYRGVLNISNPIERGVITNWDDMENIWHHIFTDVLSVNPENRHILLSESSVNSKTSRERMAQIMFEKFSVSGLHIPNEVLLVLYASGRTDGIVLDVGHGLTQVVPVEEGYVVRHGIVTSNLGGTDLTHHMAQLLSKRSGCSFSIEAIIQDADELKKMACYVPLNFDSELRDWSSKVKPENSYNLPNGQTFKSMKIGGERIRCPEGLFKPYLLGIDTYGVHEKIYHSITKCASHDQACNQKTLFANIVVAGGSSMFPGFLDRLNKEMKYLVAPDMTVKLIAPKERNSSSWLGGSILASLSQFVSMWITKEEYDESGPTIIHTRSM